MARLIHPVFLTLALLSIVATRMPGLAADAPAARTPVIFDTDFGHDIDDAFTLAYILTSPKLELRAVTTVGDPAQDRAWMVCRLLSHGGYKGMPVAFGREAQPARPIDWQIQYRRHPAVVFDRTTKPAKESAVELMLATLKAEQGKVVIIAAGPLTNVAQLIEKHPECKPWIKAVMWAGGAEANEKADEKAAKAVLGSGVQVKTMDPQFAPWVFLDGPSLERIFAAQSPLTRQVQALYELWDKPQPTLPSLVAAAVAEGENRLNNERLINECVRRLAATGPAITIKPPGNLSKLIDRTGLPRRVHVFEDYETDIEKRWWMTGKLETKDIPPGSPGVRAQRATITQDFDDLQGDVKTPYRAVVFNPVPGPPMGKHTRLSFRYKITGSDTMRVQMYSLSNGYHRCLSLKNLDQGKWLDGAVDMTQMRRPDGTGGALSEDERIDDIQFYIDPRAELLIDDIVLYDATPVAPDDEKLPFPRRFLFTGWFDTGKQGGEWPGDYEIVKHDPPLTWKAAKSVMDAKTGKPWLRISLRGQRPLPPADREVHLRFRYRISGATSCDILLRDGKADRQLTVAAKGLTGDAWTETTLAFKQDGTSAMKLADELVFRLPQGATLLVDDLLLFEPGGR